MARYLVPLLLFALLIPMFLFGLQRDPSELPSPFLDHPAPSFSLPSLHDPAETVSSDDYAGQVAIVNVWATWCVGCRQEHAFLLRLSQLDEVPVYGINWRDRRDEALAWLEQLGNPYVATGFDGDGKVGIDWGVYGAPETFLISPSGIVLYKHLGPLDEATWQREFRPRIERVGDTT